MKDVILALFILHVLIVIGVFVYIVFSVFPRTLLMLIVGFVIVYIAIKLFRVVKADEA